MEQYNTNCLIWKAHIYGIPTLSQHAHSAESSTCGLQYCWAAPRGALHLKPETPWALTLMARNTDIAKCRCLWPGGRGTSPPYKHTIAPCRMAPDLSYPPDIPGITATLQSSSPSTTATTLPAQNVLHKYLRTQPSRYLRGAIINHCTPPILLSYSHYHQHCFSKQGGRK